MNFGEQIKKIRKERNLTQQDMADKLNVSRQAVSNWENDKNLPDIEMLIIMSQVFHLTLDELILGGTQMNNMTEKLIEDTSKNKRAKTNLKGIIIGGALLALGFISLVIGTFAAPTMENYFSIAFSVMMLAGIISFMVIGIKNAIEVFKNRDGEIPKNKKLLAGGGIALVLGIAAFCVSLATGWFSGLIGIAGIVLGVALIIAAALKSNK